MTQKQNKQVTTISTVIATFDPDKDAEWAKDFNKMMTKNDFELIEFFPGIATYHREFVDKYK